MRRTQRLSVFPALAFLLVVSLAFAGCEKKEKLLDIKTPGGGVEIEKSRDGVEIDVEQKSDDSGGTRIRIETDGEDQ